MRDDILTKAFFDNTTRVGDCMEWNGGVSGTGYPIATFFGRREPAHRVAFALANGRTPAGLFVCHHCDNPRCVNPAHLFLGTTEDNNRDFDEKRDGAEASKHLPNFHRKHGAYYIVVPNDGKRKWIRLSADYHKATRKYFEFQRQVSTNRLQNGT